MLIDKLKLEVSTKPENGPPSDTKSIDAYIQKIGDLEKTLQNTSDRQQKAVDTWKKRAEKLKAANKSKESECEQLSEELQALKKKDHEQDTGTEKSNTAIEKLKDLHSVEVAQVHAEAEELRS